MDQCNQCAGCGRRGRDSECIKPIDFTSFIHTFLSDKICSKGNLEGSISQPSPITTQDAKAISHQRRQSSRTNNSNAIDSRNTMPNSIKTFTTVTLLYGTWLTHHVHTFTPPSPSITLHISSSRSVQSTAKKIIDAEFTHSSEDDEEDQQPKEMTLIEYSQNQDPEWKSMPVAFCDLQSNTYIDCTLAFYVKGEDGEEYCLGVPCETPIVVGVEVDEENDAAVTNLARVLPINPDDEDTPGCYNIDEEEKKEVFEIVARALSEEFGKGIRLKKTPRVLTVQGDLDGAIGDWKEVFFSESIINDRGTIKRPDIEEALKILDEDEEEGEKYFDMIMRRDLGDDYMKLIEDDDEDIDADILKMFDVNVEDLEDGDVDEFLKFMTDSVSEKESDTKSRYDELLKELKPSAALRLVSFGGPGKKAFTVLRPLRPLLLIGKEDPSDYTRRILLSESEKRKILPELERICKDKLEEAGFFLNGSDE